MVRLSSFCMVLARPALSLCRWPLPGALVFRTPGLLPRTLRCITGATAMVLDRRQPLDPARVMAARAFDGLIDHVVRREELAESHDEIAFVGVSQGAMVALDAVLPADGRSARSCPSRGFSATAHLAVQQGHADPARTRSGRRDDSCGCLDARGGAAWSGRLQS